MNELESQRDGLAIIGMAGRFPKAATVAAFWESLRRGVESISFFSDAELDAAGIEFPRHNPNYVKARGLLEDADLFDAAFFGVNPREAEIMDPQHRLFLECAWEALEDAGYDAEREERLIGVFGGMSMNTYLPANLLSHPELLDQVGSHQLMLANDKDFLTTRVSYKLNLRGPSLNIQTACSTSLVAVCVACQHLLNYQCDLALAGGVSVTFPQKRGHLYQEGAIGSPDGHCRAFDAKAQGTVAGEGVGIVVLKRLAEALADGDQIYAVIRGFATNNDGAQKIGYTAPSEEGQAEAIALAQAMAGVEPQTIGCIEAHGTATPLGDPIEIAGLTRAFRAGTEAVGFCAIGSVKSNIGHLDTAAGVAGLIKATLALHHKQLPPSLHFESPNPKIDFARSPFYVNTRLTEWKAGETPRRAGVSSFGLGGTNAHVVLEEGPVLEPSSKSRPAQLLVLSAKTATALDAATARLASHLKDRPDLNLADVAYTLQVGRRVFNHRRMLVCGSATEAVEALQAPDSKRVATRVHDQGAPAVAFMFPGQGAQRVNMAWELYQSEMVFRQQVDVCTEMLKPHLGVDLRTVLFPPPDQAEAAQRQLTQTYITQPALFVIEYVLAKLWMSWGVQPQAMIGHSIGEYVAACLAGVFSLKEALMLVAGRGRLMQELPGGSMLAVRLPEAEVQKLVGPDISLAAVNSPSVSVVSGETEAVEALQQQLMERGVACHRLETSHAFHSPMVEPVLESFIALVKRTKLHPPRLPYLSNVTGAWITAEQATDPAYWAQQMRQTVRFAAGLGELLKDPGLILLEIGPGQTLSTLARQHPATGAERLVLASLHHAQAEQTDVSVTLNALGHLWLAGVPVDWGGFYAQEHRHRVRLPSYPFERKRYWIEPARAGSSPHFAGLGAAAAMVETPVPQELAAAPPAEAAPAPAANGDSLAAAVKRLFGQLSGLDAARMDNTKTFVELGFDSLFLTQASQALEKQFGVRIPFGQLLDQVSTFELLTAHLEQAARQGPDKTPPPAPRAAVPGPQRQPEAAQTVPLTEAQKEIWFAAQLGEAASCAFNESYLLHVRGRLDLTALCKALQRLVDRHEALRTTIGPAGDVQHIHARMTIGIPVMDLSLLPENVRTEQLDALLAGQVNQAFDLSRGPLLRGHVVKLAPEHHVLVLTAHHLVCDGRSLGVLLLELGELYSAGRGERASPLPAPPSFADFVRRQHQQVQSPEWAAAAAWWRQQFASVPPPLDLPADHARPAFRSFSGGREFITLDAALCQDLRRLSAAHDSTLFTTLLAAYFVLLHRLSGQADLVVGIPISRRDGAGSERLVGHSVNFLPLRARLNENSKFTEHLADVRRRLLDAYRHANYTFGSLVQQLNLPRSPNRMPLVSVMFNLDRVQQWPELAGLEVDITPNPRRLTSFDLSFSLSEATGELKLDCTYSADLFSAPTVQRWLGHFQTLLAGLAANPEERIGEFLRDLEEPAARPSPSLEPEPMAPEANPQAAARPFTSTEAVLAQIWCEVIGVREVGVQDNFFDLGGHSVLIAQVISRVRRRFHVELTLRNVFESSTLADLAEEIDCQLATEFAAPGTEAPLQAAALELSSAKENR